MSYFSVSELNERAKQALGLTFDQEVWVVGEVHGFKRHAKSGHTYFDLVEKAPGDSGRYIAKIGCAFFRGQRAKWEKHLRLKGLDRFEFKDTMEIRLRARVDLFAKEGRYQLIVSAIDPGFTLGAIAKKRAQTIEYLVSSGLMKKNACLEIPCPPLHIGLITSINSAAFHDFMDIISRSRYAFDIQTFDSHMQGNTTAQEVEQGIHLLEKQTDLICIIRGGGSRTDLFYFDELSISKAIALARVPVITGIGHETDLSVADMAANRHLVTPTDTAKFLVERCDDLSERIEKAQAKMCALSEYILERAKQQSGALSQRLAMRSQYMTSQEFSGLRDIAYRMHAATIKGLNRHRNHLQGLRSTMPGALRLVSEKDKSRINMLYLKMDLAWSRIIEHADKEIQDMNKTLEKSASAIFEHAFEYMDHTKKTLALINPETIFKRGYSITLDHKGKPLKNAREVSVGEDLTTILHQGRITSIVKDREQK